MDMSLTKGHQTIVDSSFNVAVINGRMMLKKGQVPCLKEKKKFPYTLFFG